MSNENPSAADWAEARGDKWLAHLDGLEGMLRPVDAPLLAALPLAAPCRIADLGCGGGRTTAGIARAAPRGSEVCGFDISRHLVDAARAHARREGLAIAFTVADLATAAPPSPFARLLSRFGLMFFDDPPAAFANLRRWLAPGGRFAFAVWGKPADNPWLAGAREVTASLVPLPKPDPEAPSPFRYGEVEKLLALLRRAGFADVAAQPWRGLLPVGGGLPPADAAAFVLASGSSFAEELAKAGDAVVRAGQAALAARFSPFVDGGIVRMPAMVWIVTGG